LGLVFFVLNPPLKPTVQSKLEPEQLAPAHPNDAAQMEFDNVVDPNTGKIPEGALYKAYKELLAQGRIPDNINKTELVKWGWNPINDFFTTLAVTRLTYDPNNTQTFYFCTGEGWFNADAVRGAGIWKSVNGGEDWMQLPSTDTILFYSCQDIGVHPVTGDVYVCTRPQTLSSTAYGGVYRSQDGGLSWTQVLGAGNGSDLNTAADLEFTASGGIFVTIGIFNTDGIYFSETGDTGTWVKQTNGFPTSDIYRVELATAPSNDSVAYAIAINTVPNTYHIKGFYKTVDRGNTWFNIVIPAGDSSIFSKKQGWYDMSLAVSPVNENLVLAGGLNVWRTKDGGGYWEQITYNKSDSLEYMHVDQHEVAFQSDSIVYFGNDGGIWRCDNIYADNPDIYERNATYNVTQYYAGAIDATGGSPNIVGGTQDNGTNMSTSQDVAAFTKLTGADGSFCAIDHENPNYIYTSKQYIRMYRSSNGVNGPFDAITNPYLVNGGSSVGGNARFINAMEMDPADPQKLYMASDIGVWRLTNARTAVDSAWEKCTRTLGEVSSIGISKNPPNVVFFGRRSTSGRIYRLIDADQTDGSYVPENADPNQNLPSSTGTANITSSCIYVDPIDGNHVIAVWSNYGVSSIYETTDALDSIPTWLPVEGDLPDIPVRWAVLHPTKPEVCYIATEIGVFFTNNLDGINTKWLVANTGLAMVRTDMLELRAADKTILACTHGRGLFTGQILDNNNIVWTQRGPTNVGGRTRTIVIDPNDSTGKTIWAGSVSGGLWKTDQIDSVGFEPPIVIPPPQRDEFLVYPNPFYGSGLTFQLNLTARTDVSITVYSLSGQLVAQPLNKTMDIGFHTLTWDPSAYLVPGVYLVSVNSTIENTIKKLVFLGR